MEKRLGVVFFDCGVLLVPGPLVEGSENMLLPGCPADEAGVLLLLLLVVPEKLHDPLAEGVEAAGMLPNREAVGAPCVIFGVELVSVAPFEL